MAVNVWALPSWRELWLCGHKAGWHSELVGNVLMSIVPPAGRRIGPIPVIAEEAPGLSSSGPLLPPGSKWHQTVISQVCLTAEEQFKDSHTVRLQVLLMFWNKLTIPSIISRCPCCLSVQKCVATTAEWGWWVEWVNATVKHKCHFRAGWDP